MTSIPSSLHPHTKPAKSVSFNLDGSSATAKAAGSGSNTSKKKASSSAKNRSHHSKPSAVVEKKKKLLRDSLQRKHEIEVKTLEWQEKLFEGAVGVDVIIEAAKHFQPHHFTEVVIERNVLNYCGYPLCSRPPPMIKGKYRISSSKQKVVDVSELKQYCSKQCLAAAKYFKNQLNEDPVYLRDMEGMASVDVLPMDIIDDRKRSRRYDHNPTDVYKSIRQRF
ncbi:Rtr1/RPAP2 family-domain-containing protein [Paraphysoderma sedebokerense]|nr:Rtr1/RPAP2 family-domain-containing protein [Paraphysoderma sedebokerense]